MPYWRFLIMLARGTMGPMIPLMRAATSRANVIRPGYDVRWFDYSTGHQVCLEEIEQEMLISQELF